ncbi:MAG: hypothetical protein ABJE66_25200 [Deltaproteobacteria bacterium]
MADKEPDLPSARVVGESSSAWLGVAAEREAREQAIKQLLREKRVSPADQAELDDHLDQFRRRAMVRKLVAAFIIGIAALLYRAVL